MSHLPISDEYLNSYIDNQLDQAEKARAFDTIRQDESLKEKVCELRAIKEAMQQAYHQPPAYKNRLKKKYRPIKIKFEALAACFILCIAGATGWLSHAWLNPSNNQELTTSAFQIEQANNPIAETRKVVVLLSNAHPAKIKAALDETEGLLDSYKQSHQQIQVELIANKLGVNLLRAHTSNDSTRIEQMQKKYPNLSFMVCGQTINKMQTKGENVQLLPQISIATSAADQINRRLHQGWGYIKI
jgi:intracellular sulfur oxidation DsrE/DsrF family protein